MSLEEKGGKNGNFLACCGSESQECTRCVVPMIVIASLHEHSGAGKCTTILRYYISTRDFPLSLFPRSPRVSSTASSSCLVSLEIYDDNDDLGPGL